MITIKNLVKMHGTLRVLDEVNLQVKRSEVAVLVGPSGGGKSTLLRCINALEPFQSGSISIEPDLVLQPETGGFRNPSRLVLSLRRRVGMVFQQFNLFPHMTALENVLAGPCYALDQEREEAEPFARELLRRVGLGEKLHAKPSQLSGGQQQRVAIARALAVHPSAILFDEPTSALDPKMAEEVQSVITALAKEGQTMMVVTHDMPFARKVATIVHRMVAGKVVESGTPDQMIGHD
jgi:ABC-type polar amino acid transport system ATPase subunit